MTRPIVIYGGSFDPVHRAHIECPQIAAEELDAQRLYYVPAGLAPHKTHRKQTDPHVRLKMLKAALDESPRLTQAEIVVHAFEVERATLKRPTYTVETVEAIAKQHPHDDLVLLVGADQAATFPHKWKDGDRIVDLVYPVMMLRPSSEIPVRWPYDTVRVPQHHVSSSTLREILATGGYDGEYVEKWLTPSTLAFIKQWRLYEQPATS